MVFEGSSTTAPTRRELVIALHCSGAGSGRWRQLGEMLGAHYQLVAPERYGTDSVGPWTCDGAFTLADEAARTLAIIDGAIEWCISWAIPMAAALRCMWLSNGWTGLQAWRSTNLPPFIFSIRLTAEPALLPKSWRSLARLATA